jgi:hypothetical protein
MFKDFDEVADPLAFPIKGKVYTVPDISIANGLRINSGEDMADEELFRALLGDVLDELRTDDVPADAFSRLFMAALTDIRVGRAAAQIVWETGAVPERLAARVEAANNPNSKTSSNSAAETETPSPASSSTTPTPTGTKPSAAAKPPRKAPASRGRRSSSSGG